MSDQEIDPLIDQEIDDSTQPCPEDLTFRKHLMMDDLYYKFYNGYTRDDYKDWDNLGLPLIKTFKFVREEQDVKIYQCTYGDRSKDNVGKYEIYIDYSPPVLVDKKSWDGCSCCIGQVYWRYLNDELHHPEILFRFWYRYDEEDYDEETSTYIYNPSCLHYNCWGRRSLQGQIAFRLLKHLHIEIGEYEMEAFSLDEHDIYLHMKNVQVDIPREAIDARNHAIAEQQKIWGPILEKWKNKFESESDK